MTKFVQTEKAALFKFVQKMVVFVVVFFKS